VCLRASRRDARKLVFVWGWGRPRGVVVLFGATILVRSAYAEDGASLASEEPIVEVTEVVVRGTPSTDADLRNSVVISGRDIVKQNAGSVVDAVRETPGVSIQQTTPGQGTIYVRGFSGRAVGHTIDGVRMNTAFYRAGNNPYLALVDPYSLRRIVIEPGATSVEYGSDALGGAVLMSTATPQFLGVEGDLEPPTLKLFQSFASNPWGQRSHAEVTHRLRRTAYHFGITYIRDQDIRPGGGQMSPDPDSYVELERAPQDPYRPQLQATQEGTGFEFVGANLAVRRAVDRWEITAKAQAGYRPTLARYDRILPLFKEEYPARFQAETTPMSRGMVALSARHTSDSPVYRWSELLVAWQGLSETNRDRRLREICLDEPPLVGGEECIGRLRLQPASHSTVEMNRSDSATLRWIAGFRAGESINLRAGVDLHVDRVGSEARETDLLTGQTQQAPARFPDGSVMSESGLFAKAAFHVSQLRGYVGARAMGFYVALPERLGHDAFDRGAVDFSVNAGVRYALTESVGLAANFGRGVRMPNVADFSALGARAQGRYQVPNQAIAPEHSYTLDFGVKVGFPWLTMNTFVFASRYADAIVLAPTLVGGQGFSPEGDRYYHSENASRIDYLGLDLSFRAQVNQTFAFFGRYLAMLGTETNPENSGLPRQTPADRVPPYQGEIGAELLAGSKWELKIWSRFRAKQQRLNDPVNLDDNRIPEGGTPGYLTLHARSSYRLAPGVEAFVGVDNVADSRVLDHGSGFYGPGFSVSTGIVLELEP